MKPKILLCLALVLIGGVFGCKPRHIPSPPSADQVREWAGFPADFQLQATAQSMENNDAETQSMLGKPIWAFSYDNPKRSLIEFQITVCQSGTLWGTNRTQAPKRVEKQIASMRSLEINSGAEFKADSSDHAFFTNAIQILPLPNGHKAYFTVLGFGPGGTGLVGFCYERDYDLIVMEDFENEDVPVEERMKNPISPTNDLPVLFGKIEKFLDAQPNMQRKP
jgi:hypothetical protein